MNQETLVGDYEEPARAAGWAKSRPTRGRSTRRPEASPTPSSIRSGPPDPGVTASAEGRPVGSCPNCAATVEKCAESVGLCCFACSHWAYRPPAAPTSLEQISDTVRAALTAAAANEQDDWSLGRRLRERHGVVMEAIRRDFEKAGLA